MSCAHLRLRWRLVLARRSEGSRQGGATVENASQQTKRRFYHGTRADLKPGDLIQPDYASNFTERTSPWVYFSEPIDD